MSGNSPQKAYVKFFDLPMDFDYFKVNVLKIQTKVME